MNTRESIFGREAKKPVNIHITLDTYFRDLFSRVPDSTFEALLIDRMMSIRRMNGYHVMNSQGILTPGQIPLHPTVQLVYSSIPYPISSEMDRFGCVDARPVLEGDGISVLLDGRRLVKKDMTSAVALVHSAVQKKYERKLA